MTLTSSPKKIDQYIANFPGETQKVLQTIRQLIKKTAPLATEAMKYGVPAFTINETIICYAAFKNHLGLYPTPEIINAFKNDLLEYKTSKGAIQFPLDKPMPLELIKRMVEFRMNEMNKSYTI